MMNRFQLFILPQINIFTIDYRMDYHTSLDLYHQETMCEKVKRLHSDYGFKCQNFFNILEGATNVKNWVEGEQRNVRY